MREEGWIAKVCQAPTLGYDIRLTRPNTFMSFDGGWALTHAGARRKALRLVRRLTRRDQRRNTVVATISLPKGHA